MTAGTSFGGQSLSLAACVQAEGPRADLPVQIVPSVHSGRHPSPYPSPGAAQSVVFFCAPSRFLFYFFALGSNPTGCFPRRPCRQFDTSSLVHMFRSDHVLKQPDLCWSFKLESAAPCVYSTQVSNSVCKQPHSSSLVPN